MKFHSVFSLCTRLMKLEFKRYVVIDQIAFLCTDLNSKYQIVLGRKPMSLVGQLILLVVQCIPNRSTLNWNIGSYSVVNYLLVIIFIFSTQILILHIFSISP